MTSSKMPITDKDGHLTKLFKGKTWHCKSIAKRISEQKLESSLIKSLSEKFILHGNYYLVVRPTTITFICFHLSALLTYARVIGWEVKFVWINHAKSSYTLEVPHYDSYRLNATLTYAWPTLTTAAVATTTAAATVLHLASLLRVALYKWLLTNSFRNFWAAIFRLDAYPVMHLCTLNSAYFTFF